MSRRALITLGILIITVALAGTTQARRAPEPPLAELVRQADVIVHGSVEATSSEWVSDEWGNHIWTTYSIRVLDGIKGAATGQLLSLRTMGGTVGDTTETLFDVPRPPSSGEAMFLLSADARTWSLALVRSIGVEQGTVTLGTTQIAVSGFSTAVRDFLSGKSEGLNFMAEPRATAQPADPSLAGQLQPFRATTGSEGEIDRATPRLWVIPPLPERSPVAQQPLSRVKALGAEPNALTATIYDAWWTNATDVDGDGYARSAKLNWDPDVAGGSGSLTVQEDLYYRLSGTSTWTYLGTTNAHTITGTTADDAIGVTISAAGASALYEYAIGIYRQGMSSFDYVRDPSNDSSLGNVHFEGAEYDASLTARIYDAGWSSAVDTDGDSYYRLARLAWDPDVVGGNGPITVYEKLYSRAAGSGSWSLMATTTAYSLSGSGSADARSMDITANVRGLYDFRIEIYRNGQGTPDDVRDPSNDTHLANVPLETAAEDSPPAPTIASVTPTKAAAGIGAQMTIRGSNFGSSPGRVDFLFQVQGDVPATVRGGIVSWSDTQIVTTVPICRVEEGECGGYPGGASSGPLWVVSSGGVSSDWFPVEISFSHDGRKWSPPAVNLFISQQVPADYQAAVLAAGTTWSAAAGIQFSYVGTTDSTTVSQNSRTEVLYGTLPPECAGAVACAGCWSTSGLITECDLMFNSALQFSAATPTPAGAYDVQSIALHEMGHWLVLYDLYGPYTNVPNDLAKVMFGFGGPGPDTVKRTLHPDDIAGAQYIYGPATTPCTYSISPTSRSVVAGGATGTVAVTASASNCSWTATSGAAWISITNGSSGTGSGTVAYSVAANSGSARTGTLTIAGRTFSVSQDGATACSAPPIPGGLTSTKSSVCSGEAFQLNWSTVTGASGYTMELATDAGFTNKLNLTNPTVTAPPVTFTVTGGYVGPLYLRVRANASCGASSSFSSALQISYTGNTCGGPASYLIPSVAHASGANNTVWRTDMSLVNRGTSSANVTLTYTSIATGSTLTQTRTLGAGATVGWSDVLVTLFGMGASSADKGVVQIGSSAPIAAVARTYNQAATGTFGQAYPALTAADGITQGQSAVLPHLPGNAAFRTNVGFVNLGTQRASVTIRLYGTSGAQLGNAVPMDIDPGRYAQIDRIHEVAAAGVQDLSYATVEVNTAVARIWAFAAVVDNATGDPTTIEMIPAGGTGSSSYLVPSVAHASGANNTQWRTDMSVVNRAASSVNVTLTYTSIATGTTLSATRSLGAGATMGWSDVLTSLFGMSAAAADKGIVQVSAAHPLYAVSRTYNQTTAGTFGQAYPALKATEGITQGQVAVLPHLPGNAAFRTNVGFVNLGTQRASVTVRLYGSSGAQLGNAVPMAIDPGRYAQIDRIHEVAAAGVQDLSYATVEVNTAGTRIWAFAAVVDNATGDPTTIEMIPM